MDYLEHVTLEGDRWDLLAHRYYGDAMRLGLLLQANPAHAQAMHLPAGLILRVPIVEVVLAPSTRVEEGGLPWL